MDGRDGSRSSTCPRCSLPTSGDGACGCGRDAPPTTRAAPARGVWPPGTAATASAPDALPASLESRFRTISILGLGGMGIVFLAEDLSLRRQVAVKLLTDPSPDVVAMFATEAQLLAALEHDHVVRVYEYGSADGIPFLVMEYVRGPSLAARLAEGRPTIIEAVRITQDVLKGLLAAHQKGILHRDIKPSNVFVDEHGRIKVADFGLACRVARDPETGEARVPQVRGGTPAYMAPEQWFDTPPGPAADVFSVGMVLREMLTGQRLYRGAEPLACSAGQTRPVPAPSSINPSVPHRLDEIVAMTLALDPDARPCVSDLLEHLSRWLNEVQDRLRPPARSGLPPQPYKSLDSYAESDRAIFFGRDAEIAEIRQLVEGAGVSAVLVFGPCGTGKSSLVHAGIVPSLDPSRFEIVSLVSGPDPARAVMDAAAARITAVHGAPDPAAGPPGDSDARRLPAFLGDLAIATGRSVVVVIDQLEEVFTLNARGSPRIGSLFSLVREAAEARALPVRWVLSVRTEFIGELHPLAEAMGRQLRLVRLREVDAAGLAEIIEGPSRFETYGFRVQDGFARHLASEVVKATRGAGDAVLPVLQIVCSRLHERMKASASTTIGFDLHASSLGGVQGALARHVKERLESPGYADGGTMARQMLRSLTVKEAGERFARAREEDELLAFPDREAARRTLERLVDDHLVVRRTDGKREIRLVSEVICPLVDEWAREDSDVDRAARSLAGAFRQWAEGGERPDDLLTGPALRLVDRHLGVLGGLSDREQRFVELSVTRWHRRRALLAVTLAVSAVLVGWLVHRACFKPGVLNLRSEPPGVQVYEAGRLLGTTPLVTRAAPGTHRLRLIKAPYDPTDVDVQIPAGWAVDYRPVLRYPFGFLGVASDPPGARCEVRPTGSDPSAPPHLVQATPFTAELPVGRYSLRLLHAGCLPATVTGVALEANRQMTQKLVRLEKDTGSVAIRAPAYARSAILTREDGTARALEVFLPLPEPIEVPSGRYRVECRTDEGLQNRLSVEVSRGVTSPCHVWLERSRPVFNHVPKGAPTEGMALADFDRDGALDLVVGTELGEVTAISVRTARLLWSHRIGDAICSSIATGDLDGDGTADAVFACADRKVYAISGRNGAELWTFRTGKMGRACPAVCDLDRDGAVDVIIASVDGNVYALAGKTGKPLWTYPAGAGIDSAPALGDLDGDGVFDAVAGGSDGAVHAVSGRTGKRLWRSAPGRSLMASPALGDLDRDGTLEAVVASADGQMHVLSCRDGTSLHRFPTGPVAWSAAALTDLDGDGLLDIAIGTNSGAVIALCWKTRRVLWEYRTGGAVGSPIVAADLNEDGIRDVIAASQDGFTYVLDGRDGRLLMRFDNPSIYPYLPAPVVCDFEGCDLPAVATGSPGPKIRVLAPESHRPRWTRYAKGGSDPVPAVADLDGDGFPDIVTGTRNYALMAVSGRTGAILWYRRLAVKGSTAIQTNVELVDLDGDGRVDVLQGFDHGVVEACEGRTGRILWSGWFFPGRLQHLASVPDQDGDRCPDVLVFGRTGSIAGVSGRSGKTLWSLHLPGSIAAPPGLADLDRDGCPDIVVPTPQGVVRAISGRTRTGLWTATLGGDLQSTPVMADVDGDGIPDVLIGSTDGLAQALSGKTGQKLWSTNLGDRISSTAAIADLDGDGTADGVFAVRDSRLVALSGRNGATLWTFRTDETPVEPRLAHLDSDGVPDVVAHTAGGRLFLVSGRTGQGIRMLLTEEIWARTPLVIDLDEPWKGRALTWRMSVEGTVMTGNRSGPRRLAVPWVLSGELLVLSDLPWPLKPAGPPEPVFFAKTRAAPFR